MCGDYRGVAFYIRTADAKLLIHSRRLVSALIGRVRVLLGIEHQPSRAEA